jgi:hypothetical protein
MPGIFIFVSAFCASVHPAHRRINSEYDILALVPIRTCRVSFTDSEGLRHSVNVQAETLYEAAALAVRAFLDHDCPPAPMCTLDVEARSPAVTHTVSVRKVRDWLESSAKSPRDRLLKERLKGLMAS